MSLNRTMLPLTRTIALPTRDLLRGVRRAMSVRRGPLGTVMAALESSTDDASDRGAAPSRAALSQRDRVALTEAGALLPAALEGPRTDALVSTVRRALSISVRRLSQTHLMISETVVDYSVRKALQSSGEGSAARVAEITVSLLRHHAIGLAPGTPLVFRDADLRDERHAVMAVMLWLLVERGDRISQEADLLSLCFEVARLEDERLSEAVADVAELARLLQTFATLI